MCCQVVILIIFTAKLAQVPGRSHEVLTLVISTLPRTRDSSICSDSNTSDFQDSVLAVILVLIVTEVIYLELTMCQALWQVLLIYHLI